MLDIAQQIAYWRESASEDWVVAGDLIASGRTRHGLFFAHLALEKLLKAHVCKQTGDLAPRMHNLVRLAEVAHLTLDDAKMDVLAVMNAFNIEGRYPESLTEPPSLPEAEAYIKHAEEALNWLKSLL